MWIKFDNLYKTFSSVHGIKLLKVINIQNLLYYFGIFILYIISVYLMDINMIAPFMRQLTEVIEVVSLLKTLNIIQSKPLPKL